jgi:1-acyl-sn-glycerol-3-phosphate acyltransferase
VFYLIVCLVAKIYVNLICRYTVTGREHIPDQGPFILIINHLSSVDSLLIYGLVPPRLRLTGLAAMKHRNDFIVGWALTKAGAIWVRRGEVDRKALRQSLDALAAGYPLALSPEGTRSKTGALIEGKNGATFLAVRSGAPILPSVAWGNEKIFPSLKRLRRARVQIHFETPFYLPPRGDGSRSEHIQYCTDLIMARMASMLPEDYRGVYAGHPLIAYWEQLDAEGGATHPEWKRELVEKAG